MKKTLLIFTLFSLFCLSANAQCDYLNQDFEDWTLTPIELEDGTPSDFLIPDGHFPAIRFIFNLLLADFGVPPFPDYFVNDPQAFAGIDRSTDASSGDFALQLFDGTIGAFSDVVSANACNEVPDTFKIDIKYTGLGGDTLYLYGAFDEGLASIPTDFDNGLDTLPAFFLDSLIFTGDSGYFTHSLPIFVNDDMAPVDSLMVYLFATLGNDGVFLVDNIRFVNATGAVDADGDGFTADVDCDDTNADVNPGATEVCNGIDDNCDGQTDEGVTTTYYADTDSDGFGDPASSVQDCAAPMGYVDNADDCDDNNFDVNPGATEVCNGIDDNCDGQTDEGVTTTYYADTDEDGFGDPASSVQDCAAPLGYVANADDCDDMDADEFPGQIWYLDADGDGYSNGMFQLACERPVNYFLPTELTSADGDCNDFNSSVNPQATEICDNIDNNCNGQTDEDVVYQDYYFDGDSDGYGAGMAVNDCQPPSGGYVLQDGDCDDDNFNVNPGAMEMCDDLDNNCDGQIDEGVLVTYYQDSDFDGFGNPAVKLEGCLQPIGYVGNSLDCDDTNFDVNSDAPEICDNIDNNCDGQIDEDLVFQDYFLDADSDGYGTGAAVNACASPGSDYALQGGDCNDGDASVNPGAAEACNGTDDNCNGQTDEGLVFQDYFLDADSDGYGAGAAVSACESPGSDYALQDGDCDDSNADVNPGAAEACNGTDDNCNGQTDEGVTTTYFLDSDMDGFGDADNSVEECNLPPGYAANDEDCDDGNPDIFPGATEIANNGIDEDCDGMDLISSTDELAELNIRVFPNPVSETLWLENVPSVGFTVDLLNLFGQNIGNGWSEDNAHLDMGGLPAGTYLLRITEQNSARRKVVLVVKS